jgi:bifunctional ADP-heptose synthase (sugar kinase/adenylyltransferase)
MQWNYLRILCQIQRFGTQLVGLDSLAIYNKKPLPTDKIIYIDGSFDILHPGHI